MILQLIKLYIENRKQHFFSYIKEHFIVIIIISDIVAVSNTEKTQKSKVTLRSVKLIEINALH